MPKISRLLIANRGEIALRIIRTAREMGITTVSIYSEVDKGSPHVYMADESYSVGEALSTSSYLNIDKVINVAKEANVDAIHPGYGFLSENSLFAEKVESAGFIFVGPSPNAIKIMGDKLSAKRAVSSFAVPLVPGTDFPVKDISQAKLEAKKIGFPIIIKASAGGGGKGMRIVNSINELDELFSLAVNEALKSFGNGDVFLEKYIMSPRHIEIQILSDSFGNFVHLFERDCSIQRRHQKVIEEAPSALLSDELRTSMGKAAINAGKSCDYVGAGTVEFIFDTSGSFYFLEMNTRLQVEHPVTECITGIDLVREQLRVANGEKLGFNQDDINVTGHALELRIYAEDSNNNFSPDTGVLSVYKRPQGPGIRVDDGIEEGQEVSIYYDPMIAKLIVTGPNREIAIERMVRAIEDYVIIGVENTLQFGKFVLTHPNFLNGDFNTHFIENHFKPEYLINDDNAKLALSLHNYFYSKKIYNSDSNMITSKWRLR
ncbi:MAG: Acetyl-/propionyl-coenzyme A carboxylase alpha chain [Owenweeksia sp. TMED14]|nr:MAG: Acetyl-/propionyl-coenzyme A carboxylase alpha chain [Owenweeksia sp. TMED14]